MESNFDVLVRQYPSGMTVNTLLAAKSFDVHEEHIVIGNGAAELIKGLLEELNGKLGVIRPTFEEYPNRWEKDVIAYDCTENDFSYTASQLIQYFTENPVDTLVLINPDNPTGHCMNADEIKRLLQWSRQCDINLIIDESFLDFADAENLSLLSEQVLKENKNLYVVKSISKSYGVPGIRLGILASGNTDMIGRLKKDVSIWNINSMAEFFMQILDKYKSDYTDSLRKIKEERSRFLNELCAIKNLKVYPSQANYFMCEILDGISSEELAGRLLKENILIKDLTGKIHNGKQYIRIAIRGEEENRILVEKLRLCMRQRENVEQ